MRYNPALERMTAYKAGPPLDVIREEYGLERVVKLASNESSQGPFPEVLEAIAAAAVDLNRYPDGGCLALKAAVAAHTGVDSLRLVFTNGSCELLMLLGEALVMPGDHMVFPHPSFVVYRSIALSRQARFEAVPLRDHAHDLDAMARAMTPATRLVIVCNPNNPTGAYVRPDALRAFLDRVPPETLVALDEAYVEFVTDPTHEDTAGWLDDYPNLIVLRTFSKVYGLAGLRVGYGMGSPSLIETIDKVRQPFNVNSIAQVAALEALRHQDRVAERRTHVARERERLRAVLTSLGVTCAPSEANFLFLRIEGLPVPGEEVPQALLERGVMTRSGYAMDCPGWIRLTVGSTEENDVFLAEFTALIGGKVS